LYGMHPYEPDMEIRRRLYPTHGRRYRK